MLTHIGPIACKQGQTHVQVLRTTAKVLHRGQGFWIPRRHIQLNWLVRLKSVGKRQRQRTALLNIHLRHATHNGHMTMQSACLLEHSRVVVAAERTKRQGP
eukprot:364942-Chlamydomonas_euryale.AAC.16